MTSSRLMTPKSQGYSTLCLLGNNSFAYAHPFCPLKGKSQRINYVQPPFRGLRGVGCNCVEYISFLRSTTYNSDFRMRFSRKF